ncbi:retropepsin-like aspartic protease family protein [Sphingomonas aracearum]|uniref:TIGR02281 family clan AA aspartic protease n=1 Tax=Sphingomonas aracearum TaxID=2283317 RepID=A0A369VT96_9SPHN|nr:TIGR02281 family clan AA aspartic protease [Sphingomonas aracearum]RDE05263.1 TIGR02281 family clan AA aspartic protease [Sphingomonas aracearum]
MDFLSSDLQAHAPLYLGLFALVLVAAVARRIPVLRTITSIALWGIFAVVLVNVVSQRQRFDPFLGRIADVLQLDDQKVVGGEVRIRLSPDGHFWARATINGVPRRMLVDSGATITALSVNTAAAAGLQVREELFPVVLRTANGAVQAQTSDVGELRLGAIRASDLAVVVSPAFGDADILGMNFLSLLKSWRVEGNTLILVPHHPQEVAPSTSPFALRKD